MEFGSELSILPELAQDANILLPLWICQVCPLFEEATGEVARVAEPEDGSIKLV